MNFKRNLHTIDRMIRVIFSMVFIYFGFVDSSYISHNVLAMLVGGFGVFNLIVVAVGHCPLYGLVGLSTYKDKDVSEHES